MTKSRGLLRPRERWTDDQLETLRLNYADFPTFLVAYVCKHTIGSTYRQAIKLGLRKSAKYLESEWACRLRGGDVGKAHRFPKGHVPANKGLRRPGWSPGRMAETQFKKGRPAEQARNYVPIGSLRISKDGYVERKVTDDPNLYPARRWVGVHRLVWEAEHGPIPRGYRVAFKPGRRSTDPEKITVDALELVSAAEMMRRNTLHNNYPPEVRKLIQLRGVVNRAINRRQREHEQRNDVRGDDRNGSRGPRRHPAPVARPEVRRADHRARKGGKRARAAVRRTGQG